MGWNEETWKVHYLTLLTFVEREGHCRVPSRQVENGFRLGRWVHGQRMNRDSLPDHRKRSLEAISGWHWSGQQAKWHRACEVLERFVAKYGHARVPKHHIEGGFKLGLWVMHQREAFKTGTLSQERQRFLDRVHGWDWLGQPNRLPNADLHDFAEAIWGLMLGLGPHTEASALRMLGPSLCKMGLVRSYSVQTGSPVGALISSAIERAVELGFLDRPTTRTIRAVLINGENYVAGDWEMCITSSLTRTPIPTDEAIPEAVEWARKNLGLKTGKLSMDSVVTQGLQNAITSLLEKGVIVSDEQSFISMNR